MMTTSKKKTKEEDSIATVLHSTQKSVNYTLPTGTLELYNEGHQRELIVVWDTATSVYRIATEQEKADPNVGTLSAPKWGSYLNKDADSKDSPSCLIDLKALKQTQARKTFKIAWDPEFPRKIAFEIFLVKPTPITLINQFLCRKGPL